MKQIVVRFIITIMLAAFAQACASVRSNPDYGPNSERGQELEQMERMLNPSPNGEEAP
ncbi:MAG: hypothetical protein ABSH21_01950 [Verrucomicrobiia bacterium]|jgi:hypothetical protein